jgi:hypothetical protein
MGRFLKVRISADEHDRLRAMATSRNMNVSKFVRTCLAERLELEAIFDKEKATNGDQAS